MVCPNTRRPRTGRRITSDSPRRHLKGGAALPAGTVTPRRLPNVGLFVRRSEGRRDSMATPARLYSDAPLLSAGLCGLLPLWLFLGGCTASSTSAPSLRARAPSCVRKRAHPEVLTHANHAHVHTWTMHIRCRPQRHSRKARTAHARAQWHSACSLTCMRVCRPVCALVCARMRAPACARRAQCEETDSSNQTDRSA